VLCLLFLLSALNAGIKKRISGLLRQGQQMKQKPNSLSAQSVIIRGENTDDTNLIVSLIICVRAESTDKSFIMDNTQPNQRAYGTNDLSAAVVGARYILNAASIRAKDILQLCIFPFRCARDEYRRMLKWWETEPEEDITQTQLAEEHKQ